MTHLYVIVFVHAYVLIFSWHAVFYLLMSSYRFKAFWLYKTHRLKVNTHRHWLNCLYVTDKLQNAHNLIAWHRLCSSVLLF